MTGWRSRLRGASSVLLVVLASLTALAGGLALYAREELINPAAFTGLGFCITGSPTPAAAPSAAAEAPRAEQPQAKQPAAGQPGVPPATRSRR